MIWPITIYKIAGRHVLESPSYRESDGVGAVVRTMNFEERDKDIVLQVVKGEGKAKVSNHDGISVAEFDNGLAVGLSAEAGGAKFVATDDGHLRLKLPSGVLLALNLAIANAKAEALAKLVGPLGEAENLLETFQSGSGRRWTETIKTKPRRLGKPGAFVTEIITSPDKNPLICNRDPGSLMIVKLEKADLSCTRYVSQTSVCMAQLDKIVYDIA